jgi:hypothetical protein
MWVLAPARLFADVLYQNAPNLVNGANSSTDYLSHVQTFDDFIPKTSGTITHISWQGFYDDYGTPANNPIAPNTGDWTVAFYPWDRFANGAGPIVSFTIPASSVQRTVAGNWKPNIPYYNFSTDLPTGLDIVKNEQYWLLVYSNPAAPPETQEWQWLSGAGVDGTSTQVIVNRPDPAIITGDRTFTLDAIPEPSSLFLLPLGLLIGSRRAR